MQTFSSSIAAPPGETAQTSESLSGLQTLTNPRRPPHVLFLIDHLLDLGGGEGNLLKVTQLMPPELVRCSIATLRIHPEIRKTISVPLHLFPLQRVYGLDGMKAALRLRRLIHNQAVDIVQTYFETSNIWGGLVTKLSGALLLSSRRDMGILRSRKHRLAYRVINRISDRILAVSEEVKRFCVDEDGVAPGKVSVVYNGVDLEHLKVSDAIVSSFSSAEWARAEHIVTCVANLRRVKGIDVFLRAAQRICRELPGTMFLIAGDVYKTDYCHEVQQLVHTLGLEKNIRFLNFVQNPAALLKMSNVFCLLSRSEGFSNALLEAMACGVPSVVSRVGGNPEAITDGATGFLVPVEDENTAAERLLFLLRNPVRAREMGEAARVRAHSQFTAQIMIKNLSRLYDDLIATRDSLHP